MYIPVKKTFLASWNLGSQTTQRSHAITTVPFMLTSDRVANPSPIHALATSLSDCSELPLAEKLLKPSLPYGNKSEQNRETTAFRVALLNCVIILKLVLFHALQAPSWVHAAHICVLP